MNESAPKQDQEKGRNSNTNRRGFLKGAAMLGGAFAAGAVGGIAKEQAEDFLNKSKNKPWINPDTPQQESVSTLDPVVSVIDQKHSIFIDAIEAGDLKAIEFAISLIEKYEDERKQNISRQAELKTALVQLDKTKNYGVHYAIENELHFLKEREEWIVAYIVALKGPIHHYLDKKNQVAPPKNEKPDKKIDSPDARYKNI